MIGKKINQLATELAPVSTDLTIIGDPISGVSKKITLAQLGAIFSGAVSFYTNLAGFPATGDINVIYCAKDTQKLYLWSGSAYTEVFPSQALLDTYQLRSEKGVSNGYASLDSSGKVPISQLPSSIMEYKGTWNAATNTPTLANGTGDTGDVYICNVAGTVDFGAGPITFAVGDYVIYSGSIWQRSSGAVGTVTSVAASITGNAIGITGSPVTTSGTLAFAFAGTGTQYIKGDGTLATFPSTIAQAERLITEVYNSTGATLTKGTIVYINGGQGNLPTVTKALATGDSTSAQTFGVVQADITNNNNGYVVVAGKLSDLDTQAYTEGTQLYLSSTTAGTWTSTKQYAPNHLVYVGIVVRAHPTQGIVEIKIQNGYEMDELHNVAAQTPTNNDGLFWESATSLWKNKSIATVLGYTPQAQLNGTGFVKASGTTISYDNSTYVTTDTFQTISASKTFSVGLSLASAGGTNQLTSFINTSSLFSGSGGSNVLGFNSANNIYFGKGLDNGGVLQWNNSAVRYYTLPDATGTIALVGGAGVGTVTSVGLSSATSGVTIGSSPITTSGTITLAIATASGSQQGLLSSTDWTTFNNKQDALTNPVTGTGTTNYLPKFTGTSSIGNSQIFDNGTQVAVATSNPSGFGTQRFLAVGNGAASQVARFTDGANGDLVFDFPSATISRITAQYGTGGNLVFANGTGFTERMRLDASGNLGLGVTPSSSNLPTIESAYGLFTGQAEANIMSNSYYNSGFKYNQIGFATRYYQNSYQGSHIWYTAPSGTAGNAISFTQAMTLNASGNLSIGNTNDTYKLDVSGTGRFTDNLSIIKASNPQVNIVATSSSGVPELYLFRGTSTVVGYLGAGVNSTVSGIGDFVALENRLSSGGIVLRTNNSTALTIASTGAATFSSSVTAGGSGNVILGVDGTYSNYNTIGFGGSLANGQNRIFAGNSANGDGIYLQSKQGITFWINGTSQAAYINSSGNFGIGTSSPVQKLSVAGSYVRMESLSTDNTNAGTFFRVLNGATTVGQSTQAVLNNGDYIITTGTSSEAERMRITSGGFVGIGTTAPEQLLDVKNSGGGTAYVLIQGQGRKMYLGQDGTGATIYSDGAAPMWFSTNGSERMRITSDGNVGIGVTNPVGQLSLKNQISNGSNPISSYSATSGVEGQNFFNGYYASNSDGLGPYPRYFDIVSTGSPDGSNGGSNIRFFTNPVALNSPAVERMRITSGGTLLVGRTSVFSAFGDSIGNVIYPDATYIASSGSEALGLSRRTSDGNIAIFRRDTTTVGTISVTGSATAYNTSSDYRLKTDLKDFSGLDLVSKIKAYDYEWKSDKSRSYGVIAHELQSVINYAVTGVKDGKEMQGVDYSKIVPVLIKAIQELNDKIK